MKTGDKVRVVRKIGCCPVPVGSVVTLVAEENSRGIPGFNFVTEEGNTWYGNADAFEALAPKFVEGDRVLVLPGKGGRFEPYKSSVGKVGKVSGYQDQTGCGVTFEDGECEYIGWEFLASAPLADYEPIEYRSKPDANGDCHFIQWDGMKGGWMVLEDATTWATRETFLTPEAAAAWAKKNL